MKKLINSSGDVIIKALRGIGAADENVRVGHESRVIFRTEPTHAGKVTMISGGSSDHRPLYGGFVGVGMPDVTYTGQVSTSPTSGQILATAVGTDVGTRALHVVKNYTGDVMNFEMAAGLAAGQGVRVETVVVADDVVVEDSLCAAGRRGAGLTVLLKKTVGTTAEEGRDLDVAIAAANKVSENGRSMGMALTSYIVPAAGKPTSDPPEDQVKIGIGVHGGPGRHRESLTDAKDIAHQLVEPVLTDHDLVSSETIITANGTDGTPLTELYLTHGEVKAFLDTAGVWVARNPVGNYVTSLDVAGCSIIVLRVDDELLALRDAPVRTAGLRWGL